MTLVIDASVAAKWIMDEHQSNRARALKSESPLIAPSLIGAEIANAVLKAVIRGDFQKIDAAPGLTLALGLFDQIAPSEQLSLRALEIAIELKHPVYDCFYLALAERENATLVTADRKLISAAKQLGGVQVRAL